MKIYANNISTEVQDLLNLMVLKTLLLGETASRSGQNWEQDSMVLMLMLRIFM